MLSLNSCTYLYNKIVGLYAACFISTFADTQPLNVCAYEYLMYRAEVLSMPTGTELDHVSCGRLPADK